MAQICHACPAVARGADKYLLTVRQMVLSWCTLQVGCVPLKGKRKIMSYSMCLDGWSAGCEKQRSLEKAWCHFIPVYLNGSCLAGTDLCHPSNCQWVHFKESYPIKLQMKLWSVWICEGNDSRSVLKSPWFAALINSRVSREIVLVM